MMEPDFIQNIKYSKSQILEKLGNISSMSDEDLYILVKSYYDDILEDIFTRKEQNEVSEYIVYFTNPKFIQALTQAMYTTTPSNKSKRRLNKMAYDYLVLKQNKKDTYISGLLMAMSKTANRDIIPTLCALGLSEDFSATLALSRYSSEKENINIKRLDRVLMNQPIKVLTEQKIVDIFIALFDHVLPLFTGVMLDVVSPQNLSGDAEEIYGMITLAALDIMNALSVNDIKTGLAAFDKERSIMYPDSTLRINLEACSETDYPNFLHAIDELRCEGTYINTR